MIFGKEKRKAIVVFLISALVAHIAFIYAFPYLVVISNYLATRNEVRINEVYHEKPVDANFRKVVMPSPDILYSACVYDISNSDLLIEAEVPEFTYWSVSFYSITTDNFFTINDRVVKGRVALLLTKNKECRDEHCVISPSDRGIVIFRIFIPDKSLLEDLIEYQKSIHCKAVRENLNN
ncbi:MAG: DUF1254 domain-containing protein [Archaeoglobaceae archaeon]|nr:DUF1254 domain-containing protein [Archaeoglobaceae archaeon]